MQKDALTLSLHALLWDSACSFARARTLSTPLPVPVLRRLPLWRSNDACSLASSLASARLVHRLGGLG
eukprot:scaffold246615_cov27-Tisochrysis_lutea.AAC.4